MCGYNTDTGNAPCLLVEVGRATPDGLLDGRNSGESIIAAAAELPYSTASSPLVSSSMLA